MRTIYIDSDFKCHVTDDGTMTAVSTDFFDGKCDYFVEGYCLIPEGSTLTREDGKVVRGLTIFPWRDYRILQIYQKLSETMAVDTETIEKAQGYDVITGGNE